MRIRTGPPTTGDDFFDRKDEVGRLTRLLIECNHTLLTAPRRVGKTSLVLKTLEELRKQGVRTVFSNVEACSSEADFVRVLLADLAAAGFRPSLATRIRDGLTSGVRFMGRIQLSDSSVKVASDEWLDDLFVLMLRELTVDQKPLVWAIDELPYFLHRLTAGGSPSGIDAVTDLLHWMRQLRQPGGPNVTWLFSGSVGLDNFADRYGLARAVNDLPRFTLGAFSPEVAREFLRELGSDNGVPFSKDGLDAALARVGWLLPYHLQLVVDALQQLDGDPTRVRTALDVDQAYAFLLRPEVSAYFDTWWQRLNDQLEHRLAQLARHLLTEICRRDAGVARASLLSHAMQFTPGGDSRAVEENLQQVLMLLERDGYLAREDSGNWIFRSFLLRDYWRRRAL